MKPLAMWWPMKSTGLGKRVLVFKNNRIFVEISEE